MFIKRAPGLGSVEHQAIEIFGTTPFDDLFHKELGDTLTTPPRISKHIENNCVTSVRDPYPFFTARKRVRQDLAQLNARATGDHVRFCGRSREPSDVFTLRERFTESIARSAPQRFERTRWDVAHFVEHPRSMFGNNIRVAWSRASNGELAWRSHQSRSGAERGDATARALRFVIVLMLMLMLMLMLVLVLVIVLVIVLDGAAASDHE
jgi:hypothetical protein